MRLRARAFTLLISKVRVFEDGVSPSQPEAKCDWARGGCAGAKSLPIKISPLQFRDSIVTSHGNFSRNVAI